MSGLAQDYVNRYSGIAVREMKRTGIPASITLSQGMLESDFGRSSLAKEANNHFGIKCHNGWQGAKIYHDDDRKNECFRRYRNPEESYLDHSDFLVNTPRYKTLFSISSTDYKGWAHGLKKCGYATNPAYASLLIDNIEKYQLNAFDTGVRRKEVQSDKSDEKKNVTSHTAPAYVPESGNGGIVIAAGQARLKETNRVQYVIVREGDTYESLADEFQLLKWEIAKYNELSADEPLSVGQMLYLQPKRSKAEVGHETHIAKEGETMYIISQMYAVRLKSLYDLNFMDEGTEPAVGKRIKLR